MKTKGKRKPLSAVPLTAFWDTSGIVPLCCHQTATSQARQTARVYSRQVVWWATPVELVSALNRLRRDGHLTPTQSRQALDRHEHLRHRWNEIQPAEDLRHRAERLLSSHKLRAADALQLAAALVWCGNHPRGRVFIGAGGDLSDAAEGEGFTVIRLL
jgi:predicted nucleic acid-binding protein